MSQMSPSTQIYFASTVLLYLNNINTKQLTFRLEKSELVLRGDVLVFLNNRAPRNRVFRDAPTLVRYNAGTLCIASEYSPVEAGAGLSKNDNLVVWPDGVATVIASLM